MNKLLEALQAGKSIENPETWKQVQATVPAIVAIIGGVVWGMKAFGVDISLTDDQIGIIAVAVALVLSAVNAVITYVTSDKVGLQPKEGSNQDS